MKLLMVGLSLISGIALAVKTNGYHVENDIKNNPVEEFLENFKTMLRNGNDMFGISVLDPFNVDQIPIALEEFINLNALLTNLRIDGLSKYDVNKGDLKLINMKFLMNISWPLMTANTNYAMKGKINNFEIYGNGEMKISPQDFGVETVISFRMDGQHLQVKEMELRISLRALDFCSTGLFDDEKLSKLLSVVISDMVPQLIKNYHDMITDKIISLAVEILNKFLSIKTLTELLKLIGF